MGSILEKWKAFVNGMNDRGVPVPLARIDGKASLSASLVIFSFTIWVISVMGKAAGALGGIDSGQCLQMFLACAGLYWGRKFQRDEKGAVSLEGADKKE